MTDFDGTGSVRQLTVEHDGVRLGGSMWEPAQSPSAVVLMHPGSGPSDRHNDEYFPPIREHLVASGYAVCSFDKRGVGASTGDWIGTGIDDQAADAAACLDHVAAVLPGVPVGLFGHSQGGWVVVEAGARRGDVAFVVANSGPAVTPAAQERHALTVLLADRARDTREFGDAVRCFDLVVACMSSGLDHQQAADRVERAGLAPVLQRTDLFPFPLDDPDVWRYACALIDHDPRPALRALRVPTLALFGADDPIVPVDVSAVVYEACVRSDLLTVAVLAGGDHRVQRDGRVVDAYFPTLDAFLGQALAPRQAS